MTYLAHHRIYAYPVNQVAQRKRDGRWTSLGAPPGFPDIVVVLPPYGRFMGIECKTGDAKPSKDQVRVTSEIQGMGGVVLVVHAVDELERWHRAQAWS